MKSKKYLFILLLLVIIILAATQVLLTASTNFKKTPQTQSVAIHSVGNDIASDGTIHSENEATLHFQTAGKVVYLPFKVGDRVDSGQTIAQLDTYALQRQLTEALNAYQTTRSTFDQTTTNAQNNVLQTQQSANFPGVNTDKNNAINDAVSRILSQNQATLNTSVINVELANYALQLASLTAPFSGIITAEDITTPNVNVTASTSFSFADPTALVFRANISTSDIDFVEVGSQATIHVTGYNKPLSGTVEKIYPQQLTINGQNVYQVDITSSALNGFAKLGQTGTVTIKSAATSATVLVPTWTILGHNYLWVIENSHPVLKQVTVGQNHAGMTEILRGLTTEDRVIVNPASIAAEKYTAL